MSDQKAEFMNTDQMSVAELRQWLVQFGEKNQEHYKKIHGDGKPSKSTKGISRTIQKFESNISSSLASSSTGSVVDKAPLDSQKAAKTKEYCEAKDLPSSQIRGKKAEEILLTKTEYIPVFRSFGKEGTRTTSDENIQDEDSSDGFLFKKLSDMGLDSFRVVSIQKNATTPEKDNHSTSSWDVFNASSPSSMLDSPWKNTDEYQVPLFQDTVSLRNENEDNNDNMSSVTGRYTDPGSRSMCQKLVRRLSKNLDPGNKNKNRKSPGKIRNKLPMLMCKKAKDKDKNLTCHDFGAANRGKVPAGEACEPTRYVPPSTSMHNSSFVQDKTMTSGTLDLICGNAERTDAKSIIFSEEGTSVSTCSEDSEMPSIAYGAVSVKLGEIFAQEQELEDRRKKENISREEARQNSFSPGAKDSGLRDQDASPAKPINEWHNDCIESSESKESVASDFSATMEKFGGSVSRRKKTSVQKRREELERKWAEDKVPTHEMKVKWQVSNGVYKKKVVLDFKK